MGDGLLLEFPSVVAAVECAVAIQKMMVERNHETPEASRIVYRIGVHLGDVLVDGDDILGEGVNIAARLEGIAEPGGVCISGSAYEHVRGRIDADFVALGERTLKNIVRARAGLRTEGRRRRERLEERTLAPPKKRAVLALLAIAGLLLLSAAGAWELLFANRPGAVTTSPPAPVASDATAPAEAKHLSIVVLPFKNLSGDPAQDYFADGVTDNLTTDLSRIRNSFVIASTTAFTYKGKTVDAKEIGKDLGVRYVLEGSVQRDQNRVRVNAQLVDAETGAHLWAERFEEDVADLFKLQDQVVARLANTLGLQLVKAEAERGARSKNPDAVDLTMRGCLVPVATANERQQRCCANLVRAGAQDRPQRRRCADGRRRRPISTTRNMGGRAPRPTTRRKSSVRPNGRSHSLPTTCWPIMRRAFTSAFRVARPRRSAPPMRVSQSIRIPRCCTGCGLSREFVSAISNKRNPT